MEIRINKYLSQVGYCSRREADKLIEQGRVTVNNNIVGHGFKITSKNIVRVDSERINNNIKSRTYLMFNKPRGIVCTTDSEKEEGEEAHHRKPMRDRLSRTHRIIRCGSRILSFGR